jgi:hypothetical protein
MANDTFCVYILSKCCLFLTVNLVFLILSILSSASNSSNYGGIIQRETQEWNKSPIVDIVYKNLTDPVCPPEYEMVTGTFMGTKDYCVYLVGDYTVGRCKRKRGLYTVEGVDPLSFNKFQNQILCAKRDKALDYH